MCRGKRVNRLLMVSTNNKRMLLSLKRVMVSQSHEHRSSSYRKKTGITIITVEIAKNANNKLHSSNSLHRHNCFMAMCHVS